MLLVATGAVQLLGDATPALVVVGFGLLLGVPNGFNNLGLQTALVETAPDGRTGSAGGLFQTFRYFGAISATATIGVLLDRDLSSGGLHAARPRDDRRRGPRARPGRSSVRRVGGR